MAITEINFILNHGYELQQTCLLNGNFFRSRLEIIHYENSTKENMLTILLKNCFLLQNNNIYSKYVYV